MSCPESSLSPPVPTCAPQGQQATTLEGGSGVGTPIFFSGKVQGQSREEELCCGIVGGLTVVAFLVSWRVSSLIERSPCVV